MSDTPSRTLDLRLIAAILGLEVVVIALAALLFAATDGTMFERGSGLEYYALAGMIIFVIGVTFVMPIWSVLRHRQASRSSSDDDQSP